MNDIDPDRFDAEALSSQKNYFLRSPLYLLGFVVVSIFFIEAGLMFVFPWLPPLPSWLANLLDALLLIVLLAPLLHLSIFRRLSSNILALQQTKAQLQQQRDRLEEVKLKADELTASNRSLTASFEEIEDLYQNAPCGYYSVDKDGAIVKINDTILSWLGYAREEVLGKKQVQELLTPKSLTDFKVNFPRVKESGELKDVEVEYVRKNGTVLLALLNVSTIRDEHGQFVMSRNTVYDVTERKKAEESLRFHSEILRNLSEGIFLIRASDATIVFTNPQFERMFGYGPGELAGKPVSIVNAPYESSPEAVAKEINEELARNGRWGGDVQNVRKDGTAFWCHAHVSTFDHHLYGKVWVSVHEDITERKQAEDRQKQLNRALRLLSECNTAVVHADDEQKLLNAICKLIVETGGYLMAWAGFAEHDAEKSILPVAQFGDNDGYVDSIHICWADTERGQGPTGKTIRLGATQINQNWQNNLNLRNWLTAAQQRGYQSSIALPIICEGRTLGALNMYSANLHAFVPEEVQLLEELANNLAFGIEALRVRAREAEANRELAAHRRHLEELVAQRTAELSAAKFEAERANQAKSRFLAAASHDLRQPLSALKLYAGVLKGKLAAEDKELLAYMEQCVVSLGNLLSKLLDLSKLEAGVVTPRVSDFPVDDVLDKVLATYAPEAETKGLQLRCGLFGLTARTDPVLFQRIVGNLVDNAIHYTTHGGVLIGCRRRQGRRWLEIWDTGIGIPEDKTGEIFEEFKQLGDEARTRGSGLGLTIVAKTAALLGLEIRVGSRLNRGSMFAIELPPGGGSRAAIPKTARLPEKMRIAIVEDNPLVRNALVCAMENAGNTVIAASSGAELLARLGAQPPDVVVCDYRLAADETGYEVITAVRTAFASKLPAVIITGDTDPSLMRSMAEKGIAILHKPVEFEDLLARIGEARNT